MQSSTDEIVEIPARLTHMLRALGPQTVYLYLFMDRECDDEGRLAISQRDLIAQTMLGGPAVRKGIAALADCEFIHVIQGENRYCSTSYRVVHRISSVVRNATQEILPEVGKPQARVSSVAKSDTQDGCFEMYLEPELDLDLGGSAEGGKPKKRARPKRKTIVEHPRFPDFWREYDHKVGRQKALERFSQAVEAGADPDVVISQAKLYRAWCRAINRIVADPSTWLYQKRWTDEYVVPAKGAKRESARSADVYNMEAD